MSCGVFWINEFNSTHLELWCHIAWMDWIIILGNLLSNSRRHVIGWRNFWITCIVKWTKLSPVYLQTWENGLQKGFKTVAILLKLNTARMSTIRYLMGECIVFYESGFSVPFEPSMRNISRGIDHRLQSFRMERLTVGWICYSTNILICR